MKLVVAAVSPTPILWRRASGLASPKEVPASTLPAGVTAPVRANIASNSVVLPLWKGPTSAMHRGPRGLLTSGPIAASSSGARPLIGSARRCSAYIDDLARRKNVAAVHRCAGASGYRHCEPTGRRNALQRKTGLPRRFASRNDGLKGLCSLPGGSSRLSSPAATLSPTWPCTLSGCSAIELFEPPTSTLPPTPTPTDALPCAPA